MIAEGISRAILYFAHHMAFDATTDGGIIAPSFDDSYDAEARRFSAAFLELLWRWPGRDFSWRHFTHYQLVPPAPR